MSDGTANADGGITLTRDCAAITVPYGEQVTLSAGGVVHLVQTPGGSITVRTPIGALMRIDGADADALGLDGADRNMAVNRSGPFELAQVIEALQTVYDPEIPVSIVELGLIYRCEEVLHPDGSRRIEIDMSMTAPGCGMGDVLRADAARVVLALPDVDEVDVNLVWDPPWTLDRISDETRLQLGLL